MGFSIDQILPSIQSFGVFGYWIIGFASFLEAFFITGIVVPGTLIADAGGILVQRGVLDFFDLVWFIAIGSVLGGEASYWTGRLARTKLKPGSRFMRSGAYDRAQSLFSRNGGLALVFGRFSGPVAGLIPLVAALANVDRRTFVIWNVAGSIPYALVHVSIGYSIGGALGQFNGAVARTAVLLGILTIAIVLIWWVLYRLFRLMPIALSLIEAALSAVSERPVIAGWFAAHPDARRWLTARINRNTFRGLPLSCLALIFVYALFVWADTALDFLFETTALALDHNVAQFVHLFWTPEILRAAANVTALGDSRVILTFMAASLVWLAATRRYALATGLLVAVLGDVLSVAALKVVFARPRPELAYFLETSGSFPSGHAAISVAFYGMLAFVLWRSGRLSPVPALMIAGTFAATIGFSRIILIEHFVSDVLNGWLVGILWLVLGVAVAEWRQQVENASALVVRPGQPCFGRFAAVGVLVSLGLFQVAVYDKALAVRAQLQTEQVVVWPEAVLTARPLQTVTKTLTGDASFPINLIFAAQDANTLIRTMERAGFATTEAPDAGRLIDFGIGVVRDTISANTMLFPLFWSGLPNDLGMQSDASGMAPMIARIWRTRFVTNDGRAVFVASVTPDDRLSERDPTPQAIAQSPDLLVNRLTGSGGDHVSVTASPDGSIRFIDIP